MSKVNTVGKCSLQRFWSKGYIANFSLWGDGLSNSLSCDIRSSFLLKIAYGTLSTLSFSKGYIKSAKGTTNKHRQNTAVG